MGLTSELLEEKRREANGKCAICKRECGTQNKLAIDHDHATGLFRGLLCFSCNTKLGWLENNFDEVMKYLKK